MIGSQQRLSCLAAFGLLLMTSCAGETSTEQNGERSRKSLLSYPTSDEIAEPILLHASGACLATIAKLEDRNEMPSDGDHWMKAWLDIDAASGDVPEFLYLVIQHGGHRPVGDLATLNDQQLILRHDSLKVGEQHWFVFSEDYDSSKHPRKVAKWWRNEDGNVPLQVVQAIANDRFKNRPTWDAQLNVVLESERDEEKDQYRVRVRGADSLDEDSWQFDESFRGRLQDARLLHSNDSYEFEWPMEAPLHVVAIQSVAPLNAENEFGLPAGEYRLKQYLDLNGGACLATWVAANQEIWLMHAFRQYESGTSNVVVEMQFDLLDEGGIDAGGETENWYRRILRRYREGQVEQEEFFRHPHIRNGTERIYSSAGWLPVSPR